MNRRAFFGLLAASLSWRKIQPREIQPSAKFFVSNGARRVRVNEMFDRVLARIGGEWR